LAEIDDLLGEAHEDRQAEPLPDAGEAEVVGEQFIQRGAERPTVGEVEAGHLDEPTRGAAAFEAHVELQLAAHDRVDAGPAALGVAVPDPVADTAQVERGCQVAREVVRPDHGVQRDGDRLVEAAELGWAEHGWASERAAGDGSRSTLSRGTPGALSERAGPFSEVWRAPFARTLHVRRRAAEVAHPLMIATASAFNQVAIM